MWYIWHFEDQKYNSSRECKITAKCKQTVISTLKKLQDVRKFWSRVTWIIQNARILLIRTKVFPMLKPLLVSISLPTKLLVDLYHWKILLTQIYLTDYWLTLKGARIRNWMSDNISETRERGVNFFWADPISWLTRTSWAHGKKCITWQFVWKNLDQSH